MTEIRELFDISQFAGRDVLLAQGPAGNGSVKSGDGTRMWIKASGFQLCEVGDSGGYVETDLQALVTSMRDPGLATAPRNQAHEAFVRHVQDATVGATGLRPSLETGFHAVLGRAVLHTHPVYVNAFACLEGGEAALSEALGEPIVWVHYEPPGYALAAEVDRVCTAFQQTHGHLPSQIVLRNHGLIASGASGADVIATTQRLVRTGRRYFGPLPTQVSATVAPPAELLTWAGHLEQVLTEWSGGRVVVRATTRAALVQAANDPDRWLTGQPLVPDDVVYIGRRVWKADAASSPETWLMAQTTTFPAKMIVAVTGLGVVFAGPHHRMLDAMEENLLAHVLTRQLISRRGQARVLADNEIDYLLSMESEHYRQAMTARADRHPARGAPS